MATNSVVVVEQHFEPVVKLTCLNYKCKFNLVNNASDPMAHCQLKIMYISEDGRCANQEPRTEDAPRPVQYEPRYE